MEKKVVVIGASEYKFSNRETGELIEGTKVHYLDPDGDTEKGVGYFPTSANMPYGYLRELKEVPGIYNLDIGVSLSGKKPVMKVLGFNLVAPLDLDQAFA